MTRKFAYIKKKLYLCSPKGIMYMCKSKTDKANQTESMLSKKNFRSGALWIFLIVGVVLYVVVYVVMGIMPQLQSCNWLVQHQHAVNLILSIIEKFADILVIGAALGYLSNVALFLNIFKQDLEDIVVDNKFLELRSDIDKIWDRVTNVLFKSRFDKISKRLLPLIRDNYFPKNKSVYYDNYTSNVKISWVDDPANEVLNVVMENRYTVVSENGDKNEIPWKTWTKASDQSKIISHKISIDGVEQKIEGANGEELDEKTFEVKIPLYGKEEYEIVAVMEKQYHFANDYFRAYSASYIMNGMILSISHPDDLMVELIERGTCGKFEIITKTATMLVAKYNGLILPHQGYVLAMKHNK